jgi:hypothetical protein
MNKELFLVPIFFMLLFISCSDFSKNNNELDLLKNVVKKSYNESYAGVTEHFSDNSFKRYRKENDSISYELISDYKIFIDSLIDHNCFDSINYSKLEELNSIMYMFDDRYELFNNVPLNRHIHYFTTYCTGFKHVRSSEHHYNVVNEVGIIYDKSKRIIKFGNKDSVLIGVQFKDSYLSNNFRLRELDSVRRRKGNEFYVNFQTNLDGNDTLAGYIFVRGRTGEWDSLFYEIPYIVKKVN